MSIRHACIYCGKEEDLSESDIIPDALTNARITNKNVCRVNHNNKFSDLFESTVIKNLAFLTNELDIKSKKAKTYAEYEALIKIDGIEYDVPMSSRTQLFDGRVLTSKDKKAKMTSLDKAYSISKNPNQVEAVDINNISIEQKVDIDLSIFFEEKMFRMVAKIAFEWYCAQNNVCDFHENFTNIISFITNGKGTNPVAIIQEAELYNMINNEVNLGSHCLFAFQDMDGQIKVVVSLFGIVMYRITVSDHTPDFCAKNLIYQELKTDSTRIEVKEDSYEQAMKRHDETLRGLLAELDTPTVKLINGKKVICLDNANTCISLYSFLFNAIKCFIYIKDETIEPNQLITPILINNINRVTQLSLLHKKSIKRFVKEYFKEGHELIRLNPEASDKKATFMFFVLFLIGKSNDYSIDDKKLQEYVIEYFQLQGNTEITITDKLEKELAEIILKEPNYSQIIEHGADIVKKWNN